MVHGAYLIYSLPELNIAPHSGFGGCAPRPKKLSEAIEIIAPPKSIVAITIIIGIMLLITASILFSVVSTIKEERNST